MTSLMDMAKPRPPMPPRVIIMGEPGIGKTTLARDIGAVILPVGSEEGYQYLNPPAAVLVPEGCRTIPNMQWLTHLLDRLATEDHPFKAVAIDTLDSLEKVIWAELCAEGRVDDITKVDGGYGKGFNATCTRFMTQISVRLDRLRERGVMPILLAHCKEKSSRDAMLDEFQNWSLNVSGQIFPETVIGWSDCLLHAGFRRSFKVENAGKETEKRIPTKMPMRRVLRIAPAPGARTKSRIEAPDEIELTPGNAEFKEIFKAWLTPAAPPAPATWVPTED